MIASTARNAISRLDPWAPPLLLIALIWFFSSQSSLDSGLGVVDLIGRKLVHATEYALLCVLWWRALRTRLGRAAACAAAFALAAGYGAVDEYHQTFTPGRTGSPIDVAIDAAGAGLAAVVLFRRSGRAATATASRAR